MKKLFEQQEKERMQPALDIEKLREEKDALAKEVQELKDTALKEKGDREKKIEELLTQAAKEKEELKSNVERDK